MTNTQTVTLSADDWATVTASLTLAAELVSDEGMDAAAKDTMRVFHAVAKQVGY